MLNDNPILSGAAFSGYKVQLEEDKQKAAQLRNEHNVNVLMVYYRWYVTYMKKNTEKSLIIHSYSGEVHKGDEKSMQEDAEVRTRINDCILKQ